MRHRGIAAFLLVLTTGCGYNTIQDYDERASAAKQQIEVQLQRRADLIPNLVNTVKGFAAQEERVLTQVTQARAGLQSALQRGDPGEMANANEALTGALRQLMVTVEAYPDLKSNQNFLQLQDELTGTENRIATSRTDYNEAVRTYNAYIRKFPAVVTAKVTGAKERQYFEATTAAQGGPPAVDFSQPAPKP